MTLSSNTYDKDQTLQIFMNCLFLPDDLIEVRMLPSKESIWRPAKDLPVLFESLEQKNAKGEHIFFGANPRSGKGRKSEHVKLARCLFADFDHTDIDAVRERLAQTDFPDPTVIVLSGHGVHCYWRLNAALADLTHWSPLQKRLAHLFGSDTKVSDPPRLMRLPGFTNHKEPVVQAELIEGRLERSYPLADLVAFLPELPTEVIATNREAKPASSSVVDRAIAYLARCEPAISGQRGHDRTFAVARNIVYGFDLGAELGFHLLWEHFNPICEPSWSEYELRHKCEEADRKPFNKPRGWILFEDKIETNIDEPTTQMTQPYIETQTTQTTQRHRALEDTDYSELHRDTDAWPANNESLSFCVSVSGRREIFKYARNLKAEYQELDATVILPRFRKWLSDTLHDVDFDSAWTEFLKAWSKVKAPKGKGPLDNAFAKAKTTPVDLTDLGYNPNHNLSILASLCLELQRLRGEAPFPLACRVVGGLFGVCHNVANDWLNVLEALKIIHCTSKGNLKEHKASEFRYIFSNNTRHNG